MAEKADFRVEERKVAGIRFDRIKKCIKAVSRGYYGFKSDKPLHRRRGLCRNYGPSGAGKTTLMNVIGCLDGTTEGEYLLDGENILEYSEKQKARLRNEKIGFVVQDFGLIPSMSVYKNVRIPLLYSKRKMKNERKHIQDLLRQLKVLDKIDEKVHRLSGGQQQRVAIARALVNSPDIILADEPTGALDQKTGKEVMGIFSELNRQGKTIVIVTHDPQIASMCTKTIYMMDGKLI